MWCTLCTVVLPHNGFSETLLEPKKVEKSIDWRLSLKVNKLRSNISGSLELFFVFLFGFFSTEIYQGRAAVAAGRGRVGEGRGKSRANETKRRIKAVKCANCGDKSSRHVVNRCVYWCLCQTRPPCKEQFPRLVAWGTHSVSEYLHLLIWQTLSSTQNSLSSGAVGDAGANIQQFLCSIRWKERRSSSESAEWEKVLHRISVSSTWRRRPRVNRPLSDNQYLTFVCDSGSERNLIKYYNFIGNLISWRLCHWVIE